MGRQWVAIAIGFALFARAAAASEGAPSPQADPMGLSLEELGNYKITSVSKRPEPLNRSAAAVYVITGEEMRRSGYTSVAEALRMVPGVQVARAHAHTWEIGVRGFNTGLSNKLLVMIDGRSVYSPLFSGVFWDMRDVPVEDIDRIEVIRGPGAALWGANAVNGVINIITRRASEGSGWTARGAGGSEERAAGLVRYGGSLGEDADFRLSARGVQRDDGHRAGAPRDGYWMSWGQGRVDWSLGEDDRLTLLGEVVGGELEQTRSTATLNNPLGPTNAEHGQRRAANGLSRWQRQVGDDSQVALQVWYEYTDIEFTTLRERRHTADVDLQHDFPLGERQTIVWGGAYRFSGDAIENRGIATLDPDRRSVHRVDGFAQDQIALWPELLVLTLGSKLGYNEFSGLEVQPSGRVALTPNESNTLWAAVSRAVRTPTRIENDARFGATVFPAGFPPPFGDPTRPTLLAVIGNSDFDSEKALTYEIGYRTQPHARVWFDAAAFYSRYEDLLSIELGNPVDVPASGGQAAHKLIPLVLHNELSGHSYGAELAARWQVTDAWRLQAWYAYLDISLSPSARSADRSSELAEDSSPRHQAFLRSSFDLPHGIQVDGILRYVGRLPTGRIDAYVEMDARVSWRFWRDWEIAVVGQNLLESHHLESASATSTGVQRGVYGQLGWRWDRER